MAGKLVLAVGRRPLSLPHVVLIGRFERPHNVPAECPSAHEPKREGRSGSVHSDLPQKSHSVIPTISYWLHSQLCSCGEGGCSQEHKYQEPGFGDHLSAYGRLTTMVNSSSLPGRIVGRMKGTHRWKTSRHPQDPLPLPHLAKARESLLCPGSVLGAGNMAVTETDPDPVVPGSIGHKSRGSGREGWQGTGCCGWLLHRGKPCTTACMK